MRRRRADSVSISLAAIACVAAAAGCRESPQVDAGLPDSVYVQVIARLQLIPTPADSADRAEADSLRALVLSDHEVEPEQLLAFAEVAGREPGRSELIWQRIGAAVDSIREAEGLDPEVPDTGPGALETDSDPSAPAAAETGSADSAEFSAAPPDTARKALRLDPRAHRARPEPGQPTRSTP